MLKVSSWSSIWFNPCKGRWQVSICSWHFIFKLSVHISSRHLLIFFKNGSIHSLFIFWTDNLQRVTKFKSYKRIHDTPCHSFLSEVATTDTGSLYTLRDNLLMYNIFYTNVSTSLIHILLCLGVPPILALKICFILLSLAVLDPCCCMGFSLVAESWATLPCCARASLCSGLSCCGAWAPGCTDFSSCSTWAQ